MRKVHKRYKKKKLSITLVFLMTSIFVVIGLLNFYRPKALDKKDNSEIIRMANALKNEEYSPKEVEKILHNNFNDYYVKSSGDEVVIGTYRSDGEIDNVLDLYFDK